MAKETLPAPPEALRQIITLARRQVELERLIEDSVAALADLNAQLKTLSEEDLPNAMVEANLTKFVLDTGETVEVKNDFNVGIPAERKDEAFQWLEENGSGGLIKTIVAVQYGKGELDKAVLLTTDLMAQGLPAMLSRDVHWQTLKAWVVEGARANPPRPIPADLFGAYPFNKSKVKLPKAK